MRNVEKKRGHKDSKLMRVCSISEQMFRCQLIHFLKKKIYLFIFGHPGPLLLLGFSLVVVSSGYAILWLQCSGFSFCGAPALEHKGFSNCSFWAIEQSQ